MTCAYACDGVVHRLGSVGFGPGFLRVTRAHVGASLGDVRDPSGRSRGDLDQQVRSVVRREGVDPQLDITRVRRIAEEVVRAHDERSLTGVVTPVPDPAAVIGELVARVSGFGPLQLFLDDPSVEEIWVNEPSRVFVARHGRHELTNVILTKRRGAGLVERMLKSSGRRIDLCQPFVDAMLPAGHRLHVVLEGISRDFAAVNIRKSRRDALQALTCGTLSA